VRSTGGGYFLLEEKRLDPEVVRAEQELEHKVQELRSAVQRVLRRRLARLPGAEFESLCRVLLGRMGVVNIDFVRRGDGVFYFTGERTGGQRLLIALRAGEQELGRRAVGELRAGLPAMSCQEGWLLGAGKLTQDGAAELKGGVGVIVYDGDGLAEACVQKGVGTKKSLVAIDLLDIDFRSDLE
jgi:hypothetical protein